MQQQNIPIGTLVDMYKRGEMRLPEIQRHYVWRATRVRDLLDSLYRGYPSGSILMWETDEPIPTRDFAIAQEVTAFAGRKLLLDGQRYSDRLKRLRGIKNYSYVVHVLERAMSYEEVTEIFVRVNSLGAKLRSSDLALAQMTSRWPNCSRNSRHFRRNASKAGSPSTWAKSCAQS